MLLSLSLYPQLVLNVSSLMYFTLSASNLQFPILPLTLQVVLSAIENILLFMLGAKFILDELAYLSLNV